MRRFDTILVVVILYKVAQLKLWVSFLHTDQYLCGGGNREFWGMQKHFFASGKRGICPFVLQGEHKVLYTRNGPFVLFCFGFFLPMGGGEQIVLCKKTYKIPSPFSSIYIDWSLITSTLRSYTNKAATAV